MKKHVFERKPNKPHDFSCKTCGLGERSINHKAADEEAWTMPAWMEPYREYINNTGGNPVEELMNDERTNGFNNSIRMTLIFCVRSQVSLLTQLHDEGKLAEATVAKSAS